VGFKKLLILVVVVLVLFTLAFIKRSIQKIEVAKQEKGLINEFELTKDLADSFISKIVVYKGDDLNNKLVLSKNVEGIWVIENKFGVKVQKSMVDELLKELKNLKGEIRAESKDVFSDFQIEDAKAVHIVLESDAGKTLSHLLVSFLKPEWNNSFVRIYDSAKIVLVDKNILSFLNLYDKDAKLDSASLMDLKMFDFDTKQVVKIELNINKVSVVLKKGESENKAIWSIEPAQAKNEEVDSAMLDEFLQNISNMYAKEVCDPGLTIYGFEQPLLQIILEDAQGEKPVQLAVGSYIDSEKVYYVKVSPSNPVFKVPEVNIQKVKRDRGYFLKAK